jgi:hypothetical protein
MKYYNEIILLNMLGTVPIRVGKQFNSTRKIGRVHQNVVVFYKGDVDAIRDELGKVDIPKEEDMVDETEAWQLEK